MSSLFYSQKSESNHICPVCGSINVSKDQVIISYPLLPKLILSEILLIAFIVAAISLFSFDARIIKVETDKEDHSINVTVKSSFSKRRLEYF